MSTTEYIENDIWAINIASVSSASRQTKVDTFASDDTVVDSCYCPEYKRKCETALHNTFVCTLVISCVGLRQLDTVSTLTAITYRLTQHQKPKRCYSARQCSV